MQQQTSKGYKDDNVIIEFNLHDQLFMTLH